jgi:hypothetical protein
MSIFDSGDPEAVPFTSILSIDLAGLIDPNLVHMMYAFSKVSLSPLVKDAHGEWDGRRNLLETKRFCLLKLVVTDWIRTFRILHPAVSISGF